MAGGVHVHDLVPFSTQDFDTSHKIKHFTFGSYFPGMENPLDGLVISKFNSHNTEGVTGAYQYFLKVCPAYWTPSIILLIFLLQASTREHLPESMLRVQCKEIQAAKEWDIKMLVEVVFGRCCSLVLHLCPVCKHSLCYTDDVIILCHTCRIRLSVSMTQFSPIFIQWLLCCPYNIAHENSRQGIMCKCSKHSMEVIFGFASILILPGMSLAHAKNTLNDFIECYAFQIMENNIVDQDMCDVLFRWCPPLTQVWGASILQQISTQWLSILGQEMIKCSASFQEYSFIMTSLRSRYTFWTSLHFWTQHFLWVPKGVAIQDSSISIAKYMVAGCCCHCLPSLVYRAGSCWCYFRIFDLHQSSKFADGISEQDGYGRMTLCQAIQICARQA